MAGLSRHYDEVSLEGGLIEIDLDTATGNEQPPETKIEVPILGLIWTHDFEFEMSIPSRVENKNVNLLPYR
jgi:hypothetical protein